MHVDNIIKSFEFDDIHYHWKQSNSNIPQLFYGIAIFEKEKDDIKRVFDQIEGQKSTCNTDGLLQFGTETDETMTRLVNSTNEHLFIEKDFFHFSPQA